MHKMRIERFFRNLSLDELRSRTGIDQGKLSRIERGYVKPKEDEKKKLAKALNVKVEDIFIEVAK